MLALDGIHKSFGGRMVLANLEAEFIEGELCAVTGPSGEGKSTLLNILGGLVQPDAGRVSRSCSEAEIAFVLQSNEGLRARSALDNVAIPLLRRMPSKVAFRRSADALELLGLGRFAGRTYRELSGGEAQRVSIARAIAGEAKALLADEPTGQLDSRNTMIVVDSLRTLATLGATVIIVTHDAAVASRCDRVLRLSDGTLTLAGIGQ